MTTLEEWGSGAAGEAPAAERSELPARTTLEAVAALVSAMGEGAPSQNAEQAVSVEALVKFLVCDVPQPDLAAAMARRTTAAKRRR